MGMVHRRPKSQGQGASGPALLPYCSPRSFPSLTDSVLATPMCRRFPRGPACLPGARSWLKKKKKRQTLRGPTFLALCEPRSWSFSRVLATSVSPFRLAFSRSPWKLTYAVTPGHSRQQGCLSSPWLQTVHNTVCLGSRTQFRKSISDSAFSSSLCLRVVWLSHPLIR